MKQSSHPKRRRRSSNCCPCHPSATWPKNKKTVSVSTGHSALAGQSPMASAASSEILPNEQLVSTPEACWCIACMKSFTSTGSFRSAPSTPVTHCPTGMLQRGGKAPHLGTLLPWPSAPAATGALPSRIGLVRCLGYAALCTMAQHHPRDL